MAEKKEQQLVLLVSSVPRLWAAAPIPKPFQPPVRHRTARTRHLLPLARANQNGGGGGGNSEKGRTWRGTRKEGDATTGDERWLKSWRTARRWRRRRRTRGGSWDGWQCPFEEEEEEEEELEEQRTGMLRSRCTTSTRGNTGNAGRRDQRTNRERASSLSGGTASERRLRCTAVGTMANRGLWTSSRAGGASLTARLPSSGRPVTRISTCGLAALPPPPPPAPRPASDPPSCSDSQPSPWRRCQSR